MPEKIEMAKTVNEFRVGSVPTVFYIPDFITDSQHDQLLNTIYDAPISKWKSLKNRRLQNWGGVVHEKGLIAQDLPPWLTRITRRINEKSGLFPSSINHVLINEYLPNQGIMPHQDGPAYYPVVAILSLGSPVVIDFTPHPNLSIRVGTRENSVDDEISDQEAAVRNSCEQLDNFHPFSIILMPRSLLIFKDMVYSDYLHGIKDSEVQGCNKDRKTGQTIGIGHESQGLYHLTYSNSFTACSATDPPDLIHKRLSHPSLSKLQKMVPSLSSLFTLDCESCQLGKYTRATFSRSIESRSESIFSLVHFDI
ncbi:alpha-ketoglutarate-dependent dioxygenase alkB homolog 6 isoform X4 [Capsicum annuum]|uniref:alpha-ketoglutarate-dependent dioxygenase alkB homolog 6 isoform X4 n=1 Tax=Capsicum annuum TaxID=4072 RepID=UPI0007BF36CE|nr:alpha-ketoglutarate-dependent dioxygenase alkB homolog 6 isoform X4 [Capsicum annuum]